MSTLADGGLPVDGPHVPWSEASGVSPAPAARVPSSHGRRRRGELLRSGVRWSFISQVARQGSALLSTAILARLLAPDLFGIVGMAAIITGFVLQFNDLGTGSALIYVEDADDGLISTVFWLNLGWGVLAAAVVVAGAGLFAALFSEPRVAPVISVLSLTFILSGLGIVPGSILQKQMRFREIAVVESTAAIVGAVAAVVAALAGAGVWSLVVQPAVATALSTGLMHARTRLPLRFTWDRPGLKSISSYSANLSGFVLLNYWVRNADNLTVGRVLGSSALGIYAMAYRIMLYPIQNIASVVARVAFPALSAGRDDRPVMASDYLRMTRVTAAVTFPLMTAFAVMSRPAVAVLLGSKWAGVAPLIMVLAPVGLVQSVSSSAGVLFQSVGRTDVQFRWALATSPIFIGAFILGVRWGVMGVAVGYAVVSLVLWLPGMWLALRQAGMTVGNYLGALSRAGANSVVMGIVLGLVWLVANPSAWLIAAACVAGVVAYCGMVLADDRTSAREILRLVRVTGSR